MARLERKKAALLLLVGAVIGGGFTALILRGSRHDAPWSASVPQPTQEAPPVRAERAGGERQIVLEEGASLDQPHTGVEAPVAQPPAQELSAEDWKKRWLNDCATELESASKENAEQRVEHALCLGIATIMDAAGTSRKMTPGVTRDLTPLLQPHLRYFQFNDSYYSFRVGEFPDFDSLCDYRASHEKWANGRPRLSEGAAALQHWEESEPQFPMDLVAQAKTRTTQAQALLR